MRILVLALALVGVAAAPAWAVPDLQLFRNGGVAEDSVDDIGASTAGAPRSVVYMIVNGGNTTLNMPNGVTVNTAINGTCSVAIQPNVIATAGNSTLFTMQFIPTAAGAFSCAMSIFSDDPDSPFTFTMAGTATGGGGQTPSVEVTGLDGPIEHADSIAIEAFTSGSATRVFTVRNVGGGGLMVELSPFLEGNPEGCVPALFGGAVLASGESTTVEMTLQAAAPDYGTPCLFGVKTNDPDNLDLVFSIAFPPILEITHDLTTVGADDVVLVGRVDSPDGTFTLTNRGGSLLEGVEVVSENCDVDDPAGATLQTREQLVIRYSSGASEGEIFGCKFAVLTSNPGYPATFFSIVGNRASAAGCATGSAEGGWLVLLAVGYLVRRRARLRTRVPRAAR